VEQFEEDEDQALGELVIFLLRVSRRPLPVRRKDEKKLIYIFLLSRLLVAPQRSLQRKLSTSMESSRCATISRRR